MHRLQVAVGFADLVGGSPEFGEQCHTLFAQLCHQRRCLRIGGRVVKLGQMARTRRALMDRQPGVEPVKHRLEAEGVGVDADQEPGQGDAECRHAFLIRFQHGVEGGSDCRPVFMGDLGIQRRPAIALGSQDAIQGLLVQIGPGRQGNGIGDLLTAALLHNLPAAGHIGFHGRVAAPRADHVQREHALADKISAGGDHFGAGLQAFKEAGLTLDDAGQGSHTLGDVHADQVLGGRFRIEHVGILSGPGSGHGRQRSRRGLDAREGEGKKTDVLRPLHEAEGGLRLQAQRARVVQEQAREIGAVGAVEGLAIAKAGLAGGYDGAIGKHHL